MKRSGELKSSHNVLWFWLVLLKCWILCSNCKPLYFWPTEWKCSCSRQLHRILKTRIHQHWPPVFFLFRSKRASYWWTERGKSLKTSQRHLRKPWKRLYEALWKSTSTPGRMEWTSSYTTPRGYRGCLSLLWTHRNLQGLDSRVWHEGSHSLHWMEVPASCCLLPEGY